MKARYGEKNGTSCEELEIDIDTSGGSQRFQPISPINRRVNFIACMSNGSLTQFSSDFLSFQINNPFVTDTEKAICYFCIHEIGNCQVESEPFDFRLFQCMIHLMIKAMRLTVPVCVNN